MGVEESGLVLVFDILHEEFDDAAAVAARYVEIDTGVGRSLRDNLKVLGVNAATGFSQRIIDSLSGACRMVTHGFNYESRGLTHHEIADWIFEWEGYAKTYFNIASQTSNNLLQKALCRETTVAFGLLILKYKPESADAFLRGVATGINCGIPCGANDPRRTLTTWLMNHLFKIANGKQSSIVDNPRHVALYINRAWDAFLKGKKTLQYLRVPDVKVPLAISGTPYHTNKPNRGLSTTM